jgi:hypothetical protein
MRPHTLVEVSPHSAHIIRVMVCAPTEHETVGAMPEPRPLRLSPQQQTIGLKLLAYEGLSHWCVWA